MPNVAVLDMTGKNVGEITLSDAIFGIEPNAVVMHMAVVNYLANQRQGTQSTLTRSEVSGGGRKPWRQKGTGHARQGSIRSPQWRHGGIALGPKPRDYYYSLNKKVKRLALKSALSDKILSDAVIVLDEFWIGREFRPTEHGAGARELAVIADHQHQFAIGATEHAGGHAAISPGAAPRRRLAIDEIDLGPMRQRGDHGIEQADIDVLALPAIGLAMKQGRENADRGIHTGHVIDDGGTDLHRSLARLAVDMPGDAHQPAHRLQDRVITGARRIGPGLPKAGHRAIDDAGVDRLDRFVIEPVALEIADLVVLHHDIAGFCQLADDVLALRRGDIYRYRFLASIGA